jgi:hypothetical protein
MRIDGVSSQSYPIKRKPLVEKVRLEDTLDDIEGEFETPAQPTPQRSRARGTTVPARQQDMIFPRSMSRRAADALGMYLSNAGFVEWDNEVLGLDVHI